MEQTDKLDRYHQLHKNIMTEAGGHQPRYQNVHLAPFVDTTHDQYGVVMTGWDGIRYVNGLVIHAEIIDGKIWLQYDGTDLNVALELVEAGVPREDIVLGFRPPEVRSHIGFATG